MDTARHCEIVILVKVLQEVKAILSGKIQFAYHTHIFNINKVVGLKLGENMNIRNSAAFS